MPDGIAGVAMPDDVLQFVAELRAVTLAWLAGLACPVINRPDAALWYRPGAPLLAWRGLLRRSGLPLPEVVVTSDPAEARAFRHRLATDGVPGAVYTPLTEAAGYLLADDEAWERLATLQARAPVCLTEPHGAATLACIVGNAVIWDRALPPEAVALEPALSRFAAAAHLAFVEIALAPVRRGLAVVLVNTLPRLEHFTCPPATESSTLSSRYLCRKGRSPPLLWGCCHDPDLRRPQRRRDRAGLFAAAGLRLSLPSA
jgi:hypothetical protein